MNRTRGTRPGGGGPFLESVIAQTTMSSTAVPRNYRDVRQQPEQETTNQLTSSNQADTEVRYGC